MNISLKRTITIVLIFVSLMPAYIVGSLMIDKHSTNQIEQQQRAIDATTEAIATQVTQQLSFITHLSRWYASNRSITRAVGNIYFSTVVWDMMDQFNNLSEVVSSIYLIDENWQPLYETNGSIYHLENSLLLTEIKRHKVAYQMGQSVHTAYFEPHLSDGGQQGIAIVTPILPYKLLEGSDYTPKGYALVLVSFDSLSKLVKPLLLESESVDFVYGAAPTHLTTQGIVRLLTISDELLFSDMNLWFKQEISNYERLKEVQESKSTLLRFLLVALLVTLVLVIGFHSLFSKQVMKIESTMDAYLRNQTPIENRHVFSEFNRIANLLSALWKSIHHHTEELNQKNQELSSANKQISVANQKLEQLNNSLEQQVEEKTLRLQSALLKEEQQQQQLLKVLDFFSTKYEGSFLDASTVINDQLANLFPHTLPTFTLSSEEMAASIMVRNSENDIYGYVSLRKGTTFSGEDSIIFDIYIRQLASWIQSRVGLRTDSQTQCLNRHAFDEDFLVMQVKLKKNQLEAISVHIIDLNGLKPINDNLGHDAGDALIVAGAEVIKHQLGRQSFLYRIGGDEFAVLSYGFTESDASELTDKLMNAIREQAHRKVEGYDMNVSFSVGYASSSDTPMSELFMQADQRMYIEKKNHYRALAKA
ncbi:GGDEF domain-containing protein [Vibrio sp. RE86]|uniref:GGDEF domain-containing protein n=1 Tax=Vibrio sp. RE86 TaxID=2607605 RepID=UPI0014935B54|nr:GGDEF domain-containing protein [Vibrio sp. RE86]NOH81020.1 GGDEF domain-containing protein [Vibrio sp. RE86]